MIPALILAFTYGVLTPPIALVGIPLTIATGDITLLYAWSMWAVRTGLRLAGIRIVVTGREHVPIDAPCIFMSNHISNLDPPILLPMLPRTAVFLKRSLMNIPFVGTGMRLARFIPVDRDGKLESAKESVRAATAVLASGVSVTTFPEGTRSRDGRLLPFKKGPFYLAMESCAPILPITIWGTKDMMRKGSVRIVPGTARITFHEPLWPRDFVSREALMSAAREAIASALPAEMRAVSETAATV
jgi:1-acyl-sn-glycerol-3-phosphate acyltransferase